MAPVYKVLESEGVARASDETIIRSERLLVRARAIGRGLEHRVGRLLDKEHAMSEPMLSESFSENELPEARRKEIFLALVEAQDRSMSVAQSRHVIAEQFGISAGQLRDIEREGLDNRWPPLDADESGSEAG
jgi:hypothetical protein